MRLVDIQTHRISLTSTMVHRRVSITSATTSLHKLIHSTETEQVKLSMIKSLFTEIVQETELSSEPTFELEMSEKYLLAVHLMNQLEETKSFKSLVDLVTLKQNKIMRNMVVMALTNCRSPVLLESLISLESKLTSTEIATIITGQGVTGYISEPTIHDLKKIFVTIKDDYVREQTLLALGSQIFELCRLQQVYGKEMFTINKECSQGFKIEFINVRKALLKN